MNHKKNIFFSIISLLMFFGLTKNSLATDQTAVSCSAADIQAAINNVINAGGGTVNIPACDGWSADPVVQNGGNWTGVNDRVCAYGTVDYRILGAGKDSTIIRYSGAGTPGYNSGSCMGDAPYGQMVVFEMRGSGFKEFGNMSLHNNVDLHNPGRYSLYVASHQGMTNARVHHFGAPGHTIYMCKVVNTAFLFDHIYIGQNGGYPPVEWGGTPAGALTEAITDTQTTIPVTDGSKFPDSTSAGHYLANGYELMTYTGKSGNTLTGVTRGVSYKRARSAGYVVWYVRSATGGSYGISTNGSTDWADWVAPPTLGDNTGIFIEDSIFNGTYHPIAGFGGTRHTVRYNTFYNNWSGAESHGPHDNSYCGQTQTGVGAYRQQYYNNIWDGTKGYCSYGTYPRGGYWMITDNEFKSCSYATTMNNESLAATHTLCTAINNCPWTTAIHGLECFQNPHLYFWNNTLTNTNMFAGSFEGNTQCSRNGTVTQQGEYYLRAPLTGDSSLLTTDSFSKYTYPHPLQTGGPPADTTPPAPPSGVVVQ